MFSMTTGAIVQQKRLVKMSGATVVHNTVTSTDDPVGVSAYYGASGDVIAVEGLGHEPIEMTAAGAISAGAKVYAAADGKVSALSASAATYRRVGIAVEAAAADGDIILVLPYNDGQTEVVSG